MSPSPGRPRNRAVDEGLVRSTEELLREGGFRALTVDAIVKKAETTRPTFYLRYGGIPALLLDMLQTRFGDLRAPNTGTLAGDLLAIQKEQALVFGDALVVRCLAGFLDSLQENPELTQAFYEGFFAPRRAITKEAIEKGIARGEARHADDLDWICDLLSGPLVMRATFPRLGPINVALAERTTGAALRELGWTGSGLF